MEDEYKLTEEEKEKVKLLRFEVLGAGEIGVSNTNEWEIGPIQKETNKRVNGFHFGVSWSDGGIHIGGVLPDKEARKLAEHILYVLNNE